MPPSVGAWKFTYVPTPRAVVGVSPGTAVSAIARKSLQPSPICSAFWRHETVAGPPVSRFDQPWPYSCAITPESRSESRSGAPPVPSEIVTSNGAFERNRLPSPWVTITDGIVMVGSAPPIAVAGPGALLATITISAPRSWAFLTFDTKVHTPRSISAILPAGSARYGSLGIGGVLPTG